MSTPALSTPSGVTAWPRRQLSIDGTTLAYVECGSPDAEPVVLLHGYLGSHRSWRHLIEPLAERHRAIALDWIGWGASGRPLGLRLDYDSEVDRLRRVLDALGLSSCNLFAHDYGGFLGLGLCLRHPARVRRFAIMNSRAHRSFLPMWKTIFGAISATCQLAPLRAAVMRQPLLAIHRASVRRELRRGVFDEASFAYACGWMETAPGRRFYADFFRQYRVAIRAELGRELEQIRCPTHVVWSRVSPYFPRQTPLELAARIPGAQLTLVDSGHFIMEERPDEVLLALRALLAR